MIKIWSRSGKRGTVHRNNFGRSYKLHNGHINCMHTSGAVFQFVVSSVWSSQHGLCHHGPADLDSP